MNKTNLNNYSLTRSQKDATVGGLTINYAALTTITFNAQVGSNMKAVEAQNGSFAAGWSVGVMASPLLPAAPVV